MRKTQSIAHPIEVRNLTKYYGSFLAVDSVSFKIAKGEVVGFLGPNGAGKSTVMKILTCYMSATDGEVAVAGHDVYTEPLAVRRKVGYQPENVPLYDEMVVNDYLHFMAKMRGVPRADRKSRVAWVAEICAVRDVMGKLVRELSKGFRQRVGLAQALIHDPDVLILDEPMAGLDPNQIIEIRDLIKEIGQEKTIIFCSHILQEIEKIADRVLIIDRGKIVADGTAAELTAMLEGKRRFDLALADDSINERDVKQALGALAIRVSTLPQASGARDAITFQLTTDSTADIRSRIYELAVEKSWPLVELRETVLTLEDVFRTLTGRDRKPKRVKKATPPKSVSDKGDSKPEKSDSNSEEKTPKPETKKEVEAEVEAGAEV